MFDLRVRGGGKGQKSQNAGRGLSYSLAIKKLGVNLKFSKNHVSSSENFKKINLIK